VLKQTRKTVKQNRKPLKQRFLWGDWSCFQAFLPVLTGFSCLHLRNLHYFKVFEGCFKVWLVGCAEKGANVLAPLV
jgi:hypothetical protein